MSYSCTSTSFSSAPNLDQISVNKILERGQRLRNAMIQSILNNDPFNIDILKTETDSVRSMPRPRIDSSYKTQFTSTNEELSDIEREKLSLFLKGDSMCKKDELEALETLRSMSAEDLCKTTNQTFCSFHSKTNCATCIKYKEDVNCDLKRSNQQYVSHLNRDPNITKSNEITLQIQKRYRSENNKYLPYVDSIKVSIYDLVLNDRGNKKVSACLQVDKKVMPYVSQSFFVEYQMPNILSKSNESSKSKINSGLDSNNFIRFCSRRLYNEAINFKQTSIHDIENIDQIPLEEVEMRFQISCRTFKRKNVLPLGYAIFNFGNFAISPTLSYSKEIMIQLNENTPIVLGKLKVTMQLGCGRLYFGKEFIGAIHINETSLKPNDVEHDAIQIVEEKNLGNDTHEDKPVTVKRTTTKRKSFVKLLNKKNVIQDNDKKDNGSTQSKVEEVCEKGSVFANIRNSEKQILIGFIYIPNAQYLKKPVNSFITCRPFCQEDNSYSKVISDECYPIFNFCQRVPLIYEDEFLSYLRENVIVIEFWEKFDSRDILFGIAKLPLHQFFVAFRNPDITKFICKNRLPVIGTDWWEAITNPYTDELTGQVQVLLALGTEEQITNLEVERGFKNDPVKANIPMPFPQIRINNSSKNLKKAVPCFRNPQKPDNKQKVVFKNSKPLYHASNSSSTIPKLVRTSPKGIIKNHFVHKVDVGIQSELIMEPERDNNSDRINKGNITINTSQNIKYVDNGTNTDDGLTHGETYTECRKLSGIAIEVPNVKNTSELLDSLQKALSMPLIKESDELKAIGSLKATFKAAVVVKEALHLPIRKKCKSKKAKVKSARNDDILPSCYVTFETLPGMELIVTHVVPRSSSPKWDYNCDVLLPSELLFSNQKRLIFRVWRKCSHTTMVPNMQNDIILGFAALDLTVLIAGFPNIQGWFNIMDFSSKCNGQINIHVNPLEDMTVFQGQKEMYCKGSISPPIHMANELQQEEHSVDVPAVVEESELLSRTLKRKFSELDEITQRLRLRLSDITNEESDGNEDDIADEFEKDINTLCVEEDFDMIDFENAGMKLNKNHMRSFDLLQTISPLESDDVMKNLNIDILNSDVDDDLHSVRNSSCSSAITANSLMLAPNERKKGAQLNIVSEEFVINEPDGFMSLDKQLNEGKQRIDTLLGKLSLISCDTNSFTRYVSGCSATNDSDTRSLIDTEAILKDLDCHSRPNILSSVGMDNSVFEEIYDRRKGKSYPSASSDSAASDSSSLLSHPPFRAAPDGEGILPEFRTKNYSKHQ